MVKEVQNQEALRLQIGRLFWDHKLVTEDLTLHPEWVASRVLEYGQWEDFNALRAFWGYEAFLDLLSKVRLTDLRTQNFCRLLLAQKKKGETPCTRKRCHSTVKPLWMP